MFQVTNTENKTKKIYNKEDHIMVKIPRFMKEYANFSKKCIADNTLMENDIKKERIESLGLCLSKGIGSFQ